MISPPDFSQDFLLYILDLSEICRVGESWSSRRCLTTRTNNVIYYVSQTLSGPPLRYPYEERLALAVVFSVQRLRHYILLSHTTVVADSNPMVYILNRRLLQGHVAKWVIILQEYDLTFQTPKSTKALALAQLITNLPSFLPAPPISEELPNSHLFTISSNDPWYGDILLYLRTQKFQPTITRNKRRRIRHHASRYLLIGDVLYRRGIDTVLRRCLTHEEAEQVLNDCHSGACGGHFSGMATAQKVVHAGYFWPTLFTDCINAVKHCHNCQLFAPKARTAPAPLHPVVTVGPFCKWAIDFMECRPTSANGHKYIIVAVDYFTKWAEAMPTFNCKADTAARFFFNHVITRFGVPKQLVSDHGSHFEDCVWRELSTLLKFEHQFSSAYYPQGKSQAKSRSSDSTKSTKNHTPTH